MLVVNRSGHPDGLVSRLKMGIATCLERDLVTDAACQGDILFFRRLRQSPVEVQLGFSFPGDPTGLDDGGWFSQVDGEVLQLDFGIAGIQIRQDYLGLNDIRRLGASLFSYGTGNDIEGHPFTRRPAGEGAGLFLGR